MNQMTFPSSQGRITWRDVARVRYSMCAGHGVPPTVLLLGERVKISLWSRIICKLFFNIRTKR